MSNIQTGAERMPHDLSHLGFLAGQIGRLITISTTPVIAGDSFEMDAVGALRLSPLRRGLFFFQAEDGIRAYKVTGVQTCALPICTEFGTWANPAPSACRAPIRYSEGGISGEPPSRATTTWRSSNVTLQMLPSTRPNRISRATSGSRQRPLERRGPEKKTWGASFGAKGAPPPQNGPRPPPREREKEEGMTER